MKKIDSHQHFWKYNPAVHDWISEEMKLIRKDFLPEALEPILIENGFEGCVAVQADQSVEETNFLIELSNKNSFMKGVVGWVDLKAVNILERLAHYHQFPIVKGFRHILQGEDPEYMLQKDFLNGIAALHPFKFTYDLLLFPRHLPNAIQLVKKNPEQLFVIDHIAKPNIKEGYINDWKKDIQTIAQFPNVFCKLSGMVTEANWINWNKESLFPYLDVVTECFGVNRLLFGSDWPVCLVAASYEKMIHPINEYFANFSLENQESIFGKNAIQFYHL